MTSNQPSGLLVILSAPAGGGKDTMIRALLKIIPNSAKLTTTTSRSKRPHETEGIDYFFVSREDFEQKIKAGYFIEYNNCAGNYYGTPKKYLADLLAKSPVIFSSLDVNGKQHMDNAMVKNLSIFLLPDSLEYLKERARHRGGMTEKMIEARIKLAQDEIAHSKGYDYQIINENGKITETAEKLAKIIQDTIKKA